MNQVLGLGSRRNMMNVVKYLVCNMDFMTKKKERERKHGLLVGVEYNHGF